MDIQGLKYNIKNDLSFNVQFCIENWKKKRKKNLDLAWLGFWAPDS